MGINVIVNQESGINILNLVPTGNLQKMVSLFVENKDDYLTTKHEFALNKLPALSKNVIVTFYSQLIEVNKLCENLLKGITPKIFEEKDEDTGEIITPAVLYQVPNTLDELKQYAWEVSLRDYGSKFVNILDSNLSEFKIQFDQFIDQIVNINTDFHTYKAAFE